jgi:hypothetical protein
MNRFHLKCTSSITQTFSEVSCLTHSLPLRMMLCAGYFLGVHGRPSTSVPWRTLVSCVYSLPHQDLCRTCLDAMAVTVSPAENYYITTVENTCVYCRHLHLCHCSLMLEYIFLSLPCIHWLHVSFKRVHLLWLVSIKRLFSGHDISQ